MSERWLGGRPTIPLGEDDRGQFRLWLGGVNRTGLGDASGVGTTVAVAADAFLSHEIIADGWLVTAVGLELTADGVLFQVDATVRADGYVVAGSGGRAFPLPPVGRAAPALPATRATPRVPGDFT